MITAALIVLSFVSTGAAARWKPVAAIRAERWPVLTLWVAFATLVSLRLSLVNTHNAFGTDMGSYLQTVQWVMGNPNMDANLTAFGRPPLIGVFLYPFTQVFGMLEGVKVFAVLMSPLPAIGAYILARQFVRPWFALAAALAVLVYPTMAEFSAVNQISLPGILFLCWGLAAAIRIGEGEGRWWHLVPPVVLMAGTNQSTSGAYLLAAVGAFAVARYRWRLASALAVAGILALPWVVFFYRGNVPLTTGMFIEGYSLVTARVESATKASFLVLALAFFVNQKQGKYLLAIGLPLVLLSMFVFNETSLIATQERAFHIMPVYAAVAGAIVAQWAWPWVLRQYQKWDIKPAHMALQGAALVILGLVVAETFAYQPRFHKFVDFYSFVSDDGLAALDYIKAKTPADAKVMAYPQGLGIYVGGYAGRRWAGVIGEGPPIKSDAAQQHAWDCAIGLLDGCDKTLLRQREDVSYILIDTSSWQTWNQYGHTWAVVDEQPNLRRLERWGTVSLYEVN